MKIKLKVNPLDPNSKIIGEFKLDFENMVLLDDNGEVCGKIDSGGDNLPHPVELSGAFQLSPKEDLYYQKEGKVYTVTDDYFSKKDVAGMFGVSLSTVNRWIDKGILKTYGFPNTKRVFLKGKEIQEALIKLN